MEEKTLLPKVEEIVTPPNLLQKRRAAARTMNVTNEERELI